ncbi:hypothetical protein KKB99_02175 [bacterium]|nr:hypothetical protein [bacterium]MBU1024794.1 hypothetical protein [bacterium]
MLTDKQDNPSPDQILISDSSISPQTNPYRGVFGAWQVQIDWETLTAELIPARNAKTIGDIFDADLLQF